MKTRQTIAIIGASGKMGAAISKSLAKGNYNLLLFSESVTQVQELVVQIKQLHPEAEVEAMQCAKQASWEADIIIAAVHYADQASVAEKIREVANQKIVISISNPRNATVDGLVIEAASSAAEELQMLLPNAKVVKAFNTTFAQSFSEPHIGGQPIDAFIAGNDEDALEIVSELVSTAGFNPVIAGDLSVSKTLENMHLLMIRLNMKYNFHSKVGWKVLHK